MTDRKVVKVDRYGMDTSLCEICEEDLGPAEDWVRARFEDSAAHKRCLKAMGIIR